MSTEPSPRVIDYPDLDARPHDLRETLGTRAAISLYRMVAHSRGIGPSFLTMADALLRGKSLPPDLRELAILRVGCAYRAPHETFQHERIARVCGLSDRAIAAAAGGALGESSDVERQIIGYSDQLLTDHHLAGTERDEALSVLGVEQLADLVFTVGFYQLVCNFLNTFDVTPEGEAPIQLPDSLDQRAGEQR